ncbi:hypothetical protein [Pseudonocardia nigra]|uniref:hypothetical protein n=1 Tax=Pseudonocardia nigra TaxID=1921578 RepID=UPI001C5ED855|nr:hypothetical protein [Pseudonocardia nigra]
MGAQGVGDAQAWVPMDACTLPTAERPLRVAEFDALFADALLGHDRPAPGLLRLRLDPGPRTEATVRELTARESACCAFFDFQLTRNGGVLVLDVRVPDARAEVLDGIVRRAAAVRAGTAS